jgi:hypothetical protein
VIPFYTFCLVLVPAQGQPNNLLKVTVLRLPGWHFVSLLWVSIMAWSHGTSSSDSSGPFSKAVTIITTK